MKDEIKKAKEEKITLSKNLDEFFTLSSLIKNGKATKEQTKRAKIIHRKFKKESIKILNETIEFFNLEKEQIADLIKIINEKKLPYQSKEG